jgi:acetyl esterase
MIGYVVGDEEDSMPQMARGPLAMKAQAVLAQKLFGLPEPWRRRLAGPPVRLDGQDLAVDAQLLLRLMKLSGYTSLVVNDSVTESRQALEAGQTVVGGRPIRSVVAREVAVAGLPATLYARAGLEEPSGLLVFLHGGGWVIGSRMSYDRSVRFLAEYSGVRVLSVEYRRAPEHPFPAAVDDALAAFDHAVEHAAELGADPARIAVGGDSAGGNLSAVVAQLAARRGGPAPAYQLLLYPATDFTRRRPSRDLFRTGFLLTQDDITWFSDHYTGSADRTDPRLSPLLGEIPANLAPAYVATAGFDPLRDEGEEYAEAMKQAGIPVTISRQRDLVHGYFSFAGLGSRFRTAALEAAVVLHTALKSENSGGPGGIS